MTKATWLESLQSHFSQHIWLTATDTLPAGRKLWIHLQRVVYLVVKGVREDNLPVQAASLTFNTLMAMVPVLAIAFSSMKGLGGGQKEIQRLLEFTQGMPEQFSLFIRQMVDTAQNTSFASLGWISVLVLFASVVMALSTIEDSFNHIWRVRTARSFLTKGAYYISTSVVVPIFVLAAIAASAYLHKESTVEKWGLLRILPLLSVWIAFSFLNFIIPNTRVSPAAAMISGLITALLWLSWQALYITLQVGVANYNKIYVAFASVPIFLAWMQVSWMIVLSGAEIACAFQTHYAFRPEHGRPEYSPQAHTAFAFQVLRAALDVFRGRRATLDLEALSTTAQLPLAALEAEASRLAAAGLLVEAAGLPGRFVLARDPDRVPAAQVLELILQGGEGKEAAAGLPDLLKNSLADWSKGRPVLQGVTLAQALE